MIPCCFHPTRVVVIDDNREFMANLHQGLRKTNATYTYFKSPRKALEYLNETYQPNPFVNRSVQTMEEDKWEHRCLDVNIYDTHHEIYRPERFQEISTLIIDHSMPGEMSGLEICRQLKDKSLVKILLTGVADEHIAIRAFNEGLIDYYIRKQDFDMDEQVTQMVEKAQWQYFNKLSEVAIKAIVAGDSQPHALVDPKFEVFFNRLIQQKKFVEGYLCETMGSYLLLTASGAAYGLIVNSADQLESGWESGEARNVDDAVINQLKEHKKMMFYHNRQGSHEGMQEPLVQEWKNHLYPLQELQGTQETYYYAFAPDMFDVDHSSVLSFEEYKKDKGFEVS